MTEHESTPRGRAVYSRNPVVTLREEDREGGLLFDPDANRVRILNATGLFVWSGLDGVRPVSDIAASLAGAFEEAPAGRVEDDVASFLEDMEKAGFVLRIPPA